MNREIRVQNIDFRSTITDSGKMVISGYVNETEQFSDPLSTGDGHNYFREKIRKGAFGKAIRESLNSGKHIDFLAEHDDTKILASTRNDSLYLTEDERGLFVSAVVTPTSWGKDFYQLVSDGIIQNFSFGFRALDDEWDFSEDGIHSRVVNDLELFEVSLVRHPAYPQSFAEARGLTSSETIYKNKLRRFKEEMEKKEVEKREETQETEDTQESVLDPTESIISLDAKMERIEQKLDEVLGLFLEDKQDEQDEKEEEVEKESEEKKKEEAETQEEPTSKSDDGVVANRDKEENKEINKRAIELIKKELEG